MKKFLILIGTFILVNLTFCIKLECQGVSNLKGIEGFTEIENYFPTKLDFTEGKNLRLGITETSKDSQDPQGFTRDGRFLETHDGVVRIDFGDGDQENFYLFNTEEFNKVIHENASSVKGTFEDGFWWSNGYNTRSLFIIECNRISN
jgi:hypothetical protein